MTTDRPYRKAHSSEHALAELRAGIGPDFCERCVSAFERAFAGGKIGADVRLHAVPAA
jgi:HD-GYP domain-containing protein (c-di-GMP phosphodiesterase class II)